MVIANLVQVVLGVVEVASSHIESIEDISTRLRDALKHIDPPRLLVAPDCGLGFLPRPVLIQKLQNMVIAAKSITAEHGHSS
jgi:5-methyltetrahydropteroyltriglutamate--homocysteine methyltransferase